MTELIIAIGITNAILVWGVVTLDNIETYLLGVRTHLERCADALEDLVRED